MNRGDVVRVDLPAPQGKPGHEQFGQRPAIIVQADATIPSLSTVVVVPLTSNTGAARFPGAFLIAPTVTNGLTTKSVALTHQVRAIDKSRIRRVLGCLETAELSELSRRLGNVLGL
jgi:mRNA-degrading endonuclease toxin of MazEF toxin-antitoxin module